MNEWNNEWNEMKWNGMNWNEMTWNQMKWMNERMNECLFAWMHTWMNWNELEWTELHWFEMRWNERRSEGIFTEPRLGWATSSLRYLFSQLLLLWPAPPLSVTSSLSHSISCNWINTLLRAAITGRFATSGCNPAKHKSSNMLKTAFSHFYNAFSNLQLQSCVARDWCLYSSAVPVRFCYFQLQSISCLRQRAQCGLFRTSLIPSLSSSKSGPNTAVF